MNKSDSLSMPPAGKRRTFSLTLSPGALMGSCIALSAGFVLVFFLGIMLGRGQTIPELDPLRPERAVNGPPMVISSDDLDLTTGNESPEEGSGSDQVIGRGELEYREQLKRPQQPAQQSAKPQATKQPAKPQAAKQAVTPKPESNAAKPASGVAAPKATQQKAVPASKNADTRTYKYVYQTASFKEAAASDKFAARLKAAGFKARTDRSESGDGTVWYRTVIDFTGKPDDTDAMRERLKKFGVEKPLLRSKSPAG